MVTCTCYDYQHGHLCKHCHRIYCLQNQQSLTIQENDLPSSEPMDSENVDGEPVDVQEVEDIVHSNGINETDTTQSIGITPSKSVRLEAGMSCRCSHIETYLPW